MHVSFRTIHEWATQVHQIINSTPVKKYDRQAPQRGQKMSTSVTKFTFTGNRVCHTIPAE